MAVNGSEFIDAPWETIFSPYTNLLGVTFYLIVLSFIVVALYIKTRDLVVVGAFMLASGVLLSSGAIFASYPEMAFLYIIFTLLGIVGLVLGIFFMRK